MAVPEPGMVRLLMLVHLYLMLEQSAYSIESLTSRLVGAIEKSARLQQRIGQDATATPSGADQRQQNTTKQRGVESERVNCVEFC